MDPLKAPHTADPAMLLATLNTEPQSRNLGPYFDALPNEVICEHLLPHLDERSILRLSQTCHYFYYLKTQEMPKRMHIIGFNSTKAKPCSSKEIIGTLKTYTHIRRLNMTGIQFFSDQEVHAFLERQCNKSDTINETRIINAEKKQKANDILQLIAGQQHLEMLVFKNWTQQLYNDSYAFTVFKEHPTLKHLGLINMGIQTGEGIFSFSSLCQSIPKTITALNLSQNKKLTDSDLQSIIKPLPYLSQLNVSHCKSIHGNNITTWAKELTHLNISDSGITINNAHSNPIAQLLRINTKLQCLWAASCYFHSEPEMSWPPELHTLDLTNAHALGPIGFFNITRYSESFFQSLKDQCPHLRILHLGHDVSPSDRKCILNIFPEADIHPPQTPAFMRYKNKLTIYMSVR